jgi:glycosyltransferase involved in cell wall biosynthesis
MKIAQVAPLAESVPPALYGGTERIVSYLTEELVALGHDVTLFASGDSITEAELVSVCPHALVRLSPDCRDAAAAQALQMELLLSRAQEFDVVHFHTDWAHLPLFSRLDLSFLMTLHGRLDFPDVTRLLYQARDVAVVSTSEAQRYPVARATG